MFRLGFFPLHWFSLLLAINGIASSFSQDDCGESAIENCSNVLQTVMDNPRLAFPESDHDLEVSCRYCKQYIDCIMSVGNRCYKAEGKAAFLAVFSGVTSLLSDICTPGSPYAAKYLKHGSCFKTIESELRVCVDKYTAEGKALKEEELSGEEKLKKTCCYMDTSTECIIAPTRETCGNEAAELLEQATEKIYRPLKAMCSAVKYDRSLCSAASSVTMSGFLFFILMIIVSLKH